MAVYTKVSDRALSAFLKAYALGDVRDVHGIAEGIENTNYRLDTTDGRYILTLFEKRVAAADLPFFDKDAEAIDYGPLHGYTLFDADGKTSAYPFGFGLSYTTFAYRALTATRRGDHIDVSVAVTNTGTVAGEEIVQLYASFPGTAAPRPAKLLRGFTRVPLAPGQTRMVHMAVPLDQLRWWDPDTRQWKLESGDHRILVGGSSRDDDLLGVRVGL